MVDDSNSIKKMADLLKSLLKSDIKYQRILENSTSSWYFFTAILPVKAYKIRKKLLYQGIDAGIEDEIADNCARLLGFNDCHNVDDIFSRAIILPLYEDISKKQIEKIAKCLNKLI